VGNAGYEIAPASAVALAERMSNIEYGTLEVRPVVVFPDSG